MAVAVAEELSPELEVEVVDPRTLSPLDEQTIVKSVIKTRRALIVESGVRSFGVSAEVAARIYEAAFDVLDAPVGRLAAREVVIPYSPPLEAEVLPDSNRLREAILAVTRA
jgi:pyruvate dehydrogenase E1 component beta subunit